MTNHQIARRDFLSVLSATGLALSAGGLLAACGSSGSTSAAGASGSSTVSGSSAAGSSAAASAKKLSGPLQILQYNDADYNHLLGEGFQAAAKQLGARSAASNGNNDAGTQLNTFNQAIAKGVAGVAVDPVDGLNIGNLAQAASAAKTFLIASWGVSPWFTPWQTTDAYSYLTPDVHTGVTAVTEILAKELNYQGAVVRVRGSRGSGSDLNIADATDKVLKKYPRITLAGELYSQWTPETAQAAASSLLTRYPDAKAIIANDDAIATGTVAAIVALGKQPGKDILVVGNNGSDEAVKRIAAGTQLATDGTVPSLLGYLMAARLFDLNNGWTPEPGERAMAWTPIVLTKDNVTPYLDRYVNQSVDKHFDATLMSRTLNPTNWDPQVPLYPLVIDNQWAGNTKPSGWTEPAAYSTGLADGSFAKVQAEYKAHNKVGLLDASPVH